MAHYTAQAGLDDITGALTKNKRHRRLTVTRIKHIKDPVTGEEVGRGPKEIYVMNKRDYKYRPMTAGEKTQRSKWTEACRLAPAILKDKNHPMYMDLYHRWREHVRTTETPMQFPNFVRTVLSREA